MITRVLVVDDDPDVLETMQLVLEGAGCEVLVTANGSAALDLLRSHADPSLILLDLMMPGMNGWQFMAEAQHEGLLGEIPVVIVSGGAFRKEDLSALGAAAYLAKPLDIERLIAAIRKHANSARGGDKR